MPSTQDRAGVQQYAGEGRADTRCPAVRRGGSTVRSPCLTGYRAGTSPAHDALPGWRHGTALNGSGLYRSAGVAPHNPGRQGRLDIGGGIGPSPPGSYR
ncbi:hypothetical protein Veis_3309 [Verminephrobacter eiseniae EF01-2]|uniref:Uncharacterized protein n=1 Tax=Verminephrobacter eiseniae (strain EF01-2) TaxID=391735 RepID=A1WN32_VEREI|nr:hypothetical protein Veis_3309 [Verminephrobacter eiseniae EF01-2]